jgi:hypothetical protein
MFSAQKKEQRKSRQPGSAQSSIFLAFPKKNGSCIKILPTTRILLSTQIALLALLEA